MISFLCHSINAEIDSIEVEQMQQNEILQEFSVLIF